MSRAFTTCSWPLWSPPYPASSLKITTSQLFWNGSDQPFVWSDERSVMTRPIRPISSSAPTINAAAPPTL